MRQLVFFVGVLVILTTTSQIILKERTQIGTMKAIGLSNHEIYAHYIALTLSIVGIGIVIGAVCVVDEEGGVVGQYDKGVTSYLREIRPDPRGPPLTDRIMLPDSLEPGRYEVRVGMWIPSQRKRSEVISASLPHTRRYVVIDAFDVTDPR